VITTFPGAKNRNIRRMGGAFKSNLSDKPFDLPEGKCEATHPAHEDDQTCVYDLRQPWVKEWVEKKKCT
jgi:hypothetical protein